MPSKTDLQIGQIPHMDQWFGLWAMEESRFWAGYEFMRKFDLHLHLQSGQIQEAQASAASSERKAFKQIGSIAVIGIHGQMMKHVSSMSAGASTVMARRQIRAAAADPDVSAGMLHIDSPGGTVAGTMDLAADVAAFAAKKPIHAFIEDLGASAAYWVASQASRITANASGLVGSIGTYGVVYDMSGMAAMEGIKAYVVRAGKFKGMGTPGTEVTTEQLEELQRRIDQLNSLFVAGVASGRKMSIEQVTELADGRVHLAKDAKRLGLIDAVETFDQSFSRLERESRTGRKVMADHIEPAQTDVITGTDIVAVIETEGVKPTQRAQAIAAPLVATYDEIKSACIGADAMFICSQLESKATAQQAQAAWMAEQNRRIEKANENAAQAIASAKKPGVEPIGTGGGKSKGVESDSGDPIAEFDELVQAEMTSRKCSRHVAHAKVSREHPELREAMVAAHNAKFRKRR